MNKETLESYTKKIAGYIDSENPFSLVGFSFGGIIAVELNKIRVPQKTIIISSVQKSSSFPLKLKLINYLKLYKVIPFSFIRYFPSISYTFFGAKTIEEKELLRSVIDSTPPYFFKWAVNEFLIGRMRFVLQILFIFMAKTIKFSL